MPAVEYSDVPDADSHTLLLRLGFDHKRGFLMDGDHTPILEYWIKNEDMKQGQWKNAFARLTDYS